MEIKVKHIVIVLLVIIIAAVGIIVILKKNNVERIEEVAQEINNNLEIETSYLDYNNEEWTKLTYEVAKKNGDWSKLPLTDEFRNKYNEKDGIFGNMQFDKVEYKPYKDNNKYYFNWYSYLVITQGLKKTVYLYSEERDGNGWLVDSNIYRSFELFDEDGNEQNIGVPFDEINWEENFSDFCYGDPLDKKPAVTEKFIKKFPNFLDLFIHYSPFYYNKMEFLSEKSSYDKREAYFEVNSTLECKKRQYKVNFVLDDNNFLDDANVEKISEMRYDGTKSDTPRKVFYQNSNWENIKVTENYKKKFNGKSYCDDISSINIDIPSEEEQLYADDNHKYVRKYTFSNGDVMSYYIEYIYNDDKYLDDVICKRLPYKNMSIEEIKDAYLKDNPQ